MRLAIDYVCEDPTSSGLRVRSHFKRCTAAPTTNDFMELSNYMGEQIRSICRHGFWVSDSEFVPGHQVLKIRVIDS